VDVEEPIHSPKLVRFGTFEVDLQAGELWKSGRKRKLTGQPFLVLAMLLERPGQMVTREELQRRLWPDTFVDVEHSLNAAINKIREALNDSAESPHFVETLPRRGYRLPRRVSGSRYCRSNGVALIRSLPPWLTGSPRILSPGYLDFPISAFFL
jgi:DNA-binding winged helix-turn-helix (wHTH) protein